MSFAMILKKYRDSVLRAARAFYFAVLAAAALLFFLRPPQVQTDLLGLFGRAGTPVEEALLALSRTNASRFRVLIESDDFADAARAAERLEQDLPREFFRSRAGRVSPEAASELIEFYTSHGSGLLCGEDRAALSEGRFSEVSERALDSWFSPVSSGVPARRDPFGLLARFLAELPFSQYGFSLEDGYLTARADGKVFIFVSPELNDGLGISALSEAEEKILAADYPNVRLHVSGVPVHTASAAQRSRTELNVLSAVGLCAIVFLLLALFRSLRFLVPVVLSIGAGMLGGGAATILFFPEPHVLTFVFGTSLIGLAADYSFHFYLRGNASIVRPLLMAYLTTVVSFSVLLLSSFSVLRQMAVFSIVGLTFVLAFVLLFDEKILKSAVLPPTIVAAEKFARKLSAACRSILKRARFAFAAVVCAGIFLVPMKNDARDFYRPSEEAAAADRFFARVGGITEDSSFLVVHGKNLEEILQREESVGLTGTRLSAFFPSTKRQRENAELARALFERENLAATLGLSKRFEFAETPVATLENAPEPLRKTVESLYFRTPNGAFSLVPVSADFVAPAGTFKLTPGGAVSTLLDGYRAQTYRLLAAAFLVLFAVLFAVYRRRAFRLIAAPLAAILTVVAVLGFCGISLSFFHFLSFFLILGFTLDYSIFRMEGKGRDLPILLSCLTSALSFGLLAFTSFALTRSMGLALGLGLVFAYFYASSFSEKSAAGTPTGTENSAGTRPQEEWFEQKEQCAGKFRLAVLWAIYRFCPLLVFRVSLFVVGFGIFLAARPAREASKAYRRALNDAQARRGLPRSRFSGFAHIRAFIDSLFDKIDASALCRQKLIFRVEESAGTRELRECAAAGTGMFFLCSHIGNIEILQNFCRANASFVPRKMHAFRETEHSGVFLEFCRKHCRTENVVIHPTSEINVGTASEIHDAIARGELAMMAADRISAGTPARTVPASLLDRKIFLPTGAFAFARLMECPVFFVACVKTSANTYSFFAEKAPAQGVSAAYAAFLEKLVLRFPLSFFHFCNYFRDRDAPLGNGDPA